MSERLTTRLTKAFQIEHPILSAPMAFAAGGRLAAVVSAAGGLGFIGGGYGDRDWLEDQFQQAGNQQIGCGFITWSLNKKPELLAMALERSPKAIFLSFGDPTRHAKTIQKAGIPLICQVQTMIDLRHAVDCGASVIVAQASEAGGHGESRGAMSFTAEAADYLEAHAPGVLLCAAGGIADGRGLAAALMLGADGVLMGSRFWACEEALVHPNQIDAALAADGDATVRTSAMDIARRLDWPERYDIRVLANAFTKRWHGRTDTLIANADREAERFSEAWQAGDVSEAAPVVGEATGLITDKPAAAEIVERTVRQAIDRMKVLCP